MRKMTRCIFLSAATLLLASCSGKLTDKKAVELLNDAYTEGNDPDNNGGAFTIINGITIDSIHQQDDKATVYYHVSGRIDNGSKYPKEITQDPQETIFTKSLFGWKLK